VRVILNVDVIEHITLGQVAGDDALIAMRIAQMVPFLILVNAEGTNRIMIGLYGDVKQAWQRIR
jgi:hypothetical protein